MKKTLADMLGELCVEIEQLPASEQQTKVSLMASDILHSVGGLTPREADDYPACLCPADGRTTGIELIAAEQERVVSEEGYTPEHDDLHTDGQLALAAAAYAILDVSEDYCDIDPLEFWPWDWNLNMWKPKDHLANLVHAGQFIAAEIDRLRRLNSASQHVAQPISNHEAE